MVLIYKKPELANSFFQKNQIKHFNTHLVNYGLKPVFLYLS